MTSVLVGNNIDRIREVNQMALKAGRIPEHPELWVGNIAQSCV